MKTLPQATFAALLFSLSSALIANAQEASNKISTDLMQAMGQPIVPVIIQYRNGSAAQQSQRVAQAGGSLSSVFAAVRAVAAQVPSKSVAWLSSDPSVSYISLDRPVHSRTAWYSTEPINATALWRSGLLGTGVGIAVIDSGIEGNKVDLGRMPGFWFGDDWSGDGDWDDSRVVFAHNFLTGSNGQPLKQTEDAYGHGTHVAGIIAGNGAASSGWIDYRTFSGVAPNANLIDLQVLDANGDGTDSNVIAAIEMAIALKDRYNIRIINLSLGRPVYESYTEDPLCQAVEQAWKAGILVVVAAGNDGRLEAFNPEGYGTINSPGNDPYALTVGAVNTNDTATALDDTVASYSSKGPSLVDDIAKPDVMAPGSMVPSLKVRDSALVTANPTLVTYRNEYQYTDSTAASRHYFPLSGTSMAAAVVSGASALLLEASPKLTPDQVKILLMRDARKNIFPASSTVTDSTGSYTDYNDLLTVGAGYLDIGASVEDARKNAKSLPATGWALSPQVQFDPSTEAISLVADPTSMWNYNSSLTPVAVYGGNDFVDPVSGSTIIWGRASLDGSTIIWGRSDLGSSTIIWGRDDSTGMANATVTLLY